MTTAIKQYEKLTNIYLKDGDVLTTTLQPNKIAELLNTSEFLVIDGVGFNRYEVKTFKQYEPSDVDQYILSQPQPKKGRLQAIIEERKEKQLVTNGLEHLLSIYNSHHEQG